MANTKGVVNKMATFLETIDWSEPLWFMANIVSLHAAVVILWSLFFAAIEKYNWFEDSKINKVKKGENYRCASAPVHLFVLVG